MELLKQSAAWFSGEAACKQYAELKTLEDRSVFLYSYLKQIASETMDQKGYVFKVAFFLADAVASSTLPYAAYPALIDAEKNPFVALLKTLKKPYTNEAMYCVMMAILYGAADALNPNEWIYDASEFEETRYRNTLKGRGREFVSTSGELLPNPEAFAIDEGLAFARTELIWMFRMAG